jgi:hypothetical protein
MKITKKLPQFVGTAPIAQEAEFKTHDKTTYPFKPVLKQPKCVKIILNSTDWQSGSTLTASRFKVNLPTEFQNTKLNLVVDSFIVSASPNSVSNLSLFPYYLRIAEYRSPYSYSSMTGTTSGVILLTTGTSYFNNSSREAGGNTLVDSTIFDRTITIEVASPHFDTAATGGVANPWSLVLSLFDNVEE